MFVLEPFYLSNIFCSLRVDAIAAKVEELSEASLMMQTSNKANANSQAKLPPVLDERITYIEEQVSRLSLLSMERFVLLKEISQQWLLKCDFGRCGKSRSGRNRVHGRDVLVSLPHPFFRLSMSPCVNLSCFVCLSVSWSVSLNLCLCFSPPVCLFACVHFCLFICLFSVTSSQA